MIDKATHGTATAPLLARPRYRADIDGLRAIAVLTVIGFHAFPDWVPGGFVGVDVFFVISGYLISTVILQNLEQDGGLSFSEFYARRIKRIFPALCLVLGSVYAFGWFALLPDEFKQLGKHIASGAGFVSNFAFWQEAGYFDNAADTKPLLHLWSLGIEEQFYIFWPLTLYLAWRKRISLLVVCLVIGVASFVLNMASVQSHSLAAFYSPATRVWELLGGALVAYTVIASEARQSMNSGDMDCHGLRPRSDEEKLSLRAERGNPGGQGPWQPASATIGASTLQNIQAGVGIGLIAGAVAFIDKTRAFPGAWALLPTLGAALLIWAGPAAWLNRKVMSQRALVWIGLISFPLYLWHWPLLSLARIVQSATPPPEVRLALIAASFVLAWLTYKLLEKPIRFGGRSNPPCLVVDPLYVIARPQAAANQEVRGHGLLHCVRNDEAKRGNDEAKRGNDEAKRCNNEASRCTDEAKRGSRTKVLALCAFAAVLGALGYATYSLEGLAFRLKGFEPLTSQFQTPGFEAERKLCHEKYPDYKGSCILRPGKPAGATEAFTFLGDSHSEALVAGFTARYPQYTVASFAVGGCLAFIGIERFSADGAQGCPALLEPALGHLSSAGNHSTVVITDRFAAYISGTGFGDIENRTLVPGHLHIQAPGQRIARKDGRYDEIFSIGLRQTLTFLKQQNKQVVFVHQAPELGFDPKACVNRPLRFATPNCQVSRQQVEQRQLAYRTAVKQVLADFPQVIVVDPMQLLCDKEVCTAVKGGQVLYRDSDHLNTQGASLLAEWIATSLRVSQ